MREILNRRFAGASGYVGSTLLLGIVLGLVMMPQPARSAPDLYSVTVPMDAQGADAREAAYRAGLELVLVRVTGSDDELHREQLAEVFPNPGRYVLRFRPGSDETLEVTFDGEAIERVLRQTHHAIWDAERPLTLVWLAVDWGDGQREIIGTDDAMQPLGATRSIDRNRLLRQRVEDTARRRGIPIAFPLLDAEDLEAISFSDIWGGFDEPLVAASRRYGASSILVGRVRPDSMQPNRWSYRFGDEHLSWSGEPEEVTHLLADKLAAEFAISGDAELESYRVRIDGVDSILAYGRIDQMMSNLGVLENFSLRSVAGSKLEYRVNVYGGVDRLSRALQLSGVIKPSRVVDSASMPVVPDPFLLTFEYQP